MDLDQLSQEITALIQPVVEGAGFELVEVQYRQEPAGWTLRIIIFQKDGVSIDDCAKISREASHLLDVEDLLPHKYNLEVSSPGLDRPLRTERDFERYINEKVTLIVVGPNEKNKDMIGVLRGVRSGEITVQTEEGQEILPIERIVKAKLVIEF